MGDIPGRIEAVLLDAGGVFLLPDPDVMLPPLRAMGLEPSLATLDRAHYAAIAAVDALDLTSDVQRKGMWEVYRRTYVRACGVPEPQVPVAADAVGRYFDGHAWTRVSEGSVAALRRLAEAGVALGIVSNAVGTIAEMLSTAEICQVGEGAGVPVDVVVDSYVVGVEKPDPRIFEIALAELNVAPEHAVHVGDAVHADVLGARAAGVRPIHLDPLGLCPAPEDGHDHVASLDEVRRLVLGPAG